MMSARSRTLNAHCEMDDSQVERHVVDGVDARWRPPDAAIGLSVGGSFTGSTWFRLPDVLTGLKGDERIDRRTVS